MLNISYGKPKIDTVCLTILVFVMVLVLIVLLSLGTGMGLAIDEPNTECISKGIPILFAIGLFIILGTSVNIDKINICKKTGFVWEKLPYREYYICSTYRSRW